MRIVILFAALLLSAWPGAAQPSNLVIDTETPQGALLQQIGLQDDAKLKLQMLEQFVRDYPNHEAVGWVLSQMPEAYVKLGQPDKALEACDRLLAKEPANAAGAHGCLKIAEGTKNPDLIKKWALETHAASEKTIAAPKPKFEYEDEETEWKQSIDFAKQVATYSEYSLYATALQTADPGKKIELIDALRKGNPESQYLPQLTEQAFLAYRQAGNLEKAIEIAENAMAKGHASADMMVVAADYYLNQKKDYAKTIDYCKKLTASLATEQAPKGMSPEDWAKKKDTILGTGYWMMGVAYANQRKYASADRALRKALPKVQGNTLMKAGALFFLGLSNFQLGNKSGKEKQILDAFKFTKQCAAMKSPYQPQARKNLKAIQTQYRIK